MNRGLRHLFLLGIIFLGLVAIVSMFRDTGSDVKDFNVQEFNEALDSGEIAEMEMQPKNKIYLINGKLTNDDEFVTRIPDNPDVISSVYDIAVEQDVAFEEEEQPSAFLNFLMMMLPLAIIGIIFFLLLTRAQGGGGGGGRVMNFGKSKAKMYSEEEEKVRFKDVAGADEEKQELVEVVEFLKDPRKFTAVGARIPKGVLLVGPPGTGKTLLAKAVAGEAGKPFFTISGSDFVEMFVGVGASRVRDLFENAKKNSPCIIFIDEIDAVGRQRGAGLGGGHDEREQTLNQLLVEMDGFDANEGIIMIAATNRPDILDPALLRPGRFDRQITVDRPDVRGREAILEVHSKGKPLDETVELRTIAMRTPGFSGADLENLLNEAALIAARFDRTSIDKNDVDEAIDRVIAGPAKKSRVISEKERKIVAYHESGHTVIGMVLDDADTVHKVTIIPRGQAGGYAVMLPKEDRYMITKTELLDKITGLLGGRVSEELTFGKNEVSTGAHNDFQRATGIAHKMITEYGMSDKIGPTQFTSGGDEVFLGRDIQSEQGYSDAIAHVIDQEMQEIINKCYERAKSILTEYNEQLELISQTLLEVETLDAKQIKSLFEEGVLPPEPEKDEDDEQNDVKVTIKSKEDEASYEKVKEKADMKLTEKKQDRVKEETKQPEQKEDHQEDDQGESTEEDDSNKE